MGELVLVLLVTMSAEAKKDPGITLFDGENYSLWKHRIRGLIEDEDALTVLDDPIPEKKEDDWKKKERIAKGIIRRHLHNTLVLIATEEDSARDVIKKLDSVYDRKSGASKIAVKKKMANFKIKDDIPLGNQLLLFDDLLIEYRSATGKTLDDDEKITILLIALPPSYTEKNGVHKNMND